MWRRKGKERKGGRGKKGEESEVEKGKRKGSFDSTPIFKRRRLRGRQAGRSFAKDGPDNTYSVQSIHIAYMQWHCRRTSEYSSTTDLELTVVMGQYPWPDNSWLSLLNFKNNISNFIIRYYPIAWLFKWINYLLIICGMVFFLRFDFPLSEHVYVLLTMNCSVLDYYVAYVGAT